MRRRFALFALALAGVAEAADGTSATEAARAALEQALRAAHPDAVRIDTKRIGGKTVESGGAHWVASVPDFVDVPRRVIVPVGLVEGGHSVGTGTVTLAVSLVRPVRCTVRALRPGEEVVDADFTVLERDVAGLKGPLSAGSKVSGMRARRFIREGATVVEGDLETTPAVVKGREVSVVVAAATVRIEARGIAEEDGEPGRRIRVRSKGSEESYMAEVVGQGRVRVAGR